MKVLKDVLNIVFLVSLIFAGVGLVACLALEYIVSFFISTIEIEDALWKAVFICFGSAVCSFILSHLVSKK